jgi:drug/metabolite transporter (DMT)-like permease
MWNNDSPTLEPSWFCIAVEDSGQFWLLKTYPASQVSVFTFLAPIFGVLAGHLLLAEPLTWRLGVALTFVALGIYLVNKPSAPG